MKLYYTPGASSLAPHIVAYEAGLDLEYEKVDLKTQTTDAGQPYPKINPKGCVPALELQDGRVLTEASAILLYLGRQAPASALVPASDTLEFYNEQEWLSFIGTELHKGFEPLWTATIPDAGRRLATERLQRRLSYLDHCLERRSYLLGERFTVADAYCFTILSWTSFHRIDLTAHPNVSAYQRRVSQRPKVRKALEAEGLLKVDRLSA